MFQTIWFVISLQTELAVLLVLRTRRFSLRSRPSKLLFWATTVVAIIGFALPFVPGLADMFSLVEPSWQLMVFSVALVGAYASASEVTKRAFYPRASRLRRH